MDEHAPQDAVVQQAERPPLIPKKWQTILIGTLILVMVLIIVLFAGGPVTKKRSAVVPERLQPAPAAKTSIDQARRDLEDQIARAELAKDQAKRISTDWPALNRKAEGIPGQGAVGPDGRTYYPGYERQETVDPLEAQRAKKEYDSLFASNIALTYRPKEQSVVTSTIEPSKPIAEMAQVKPAAPTAVKTEAKPAPEESGYKLMEGTILEAATVNRLEGSFTGPVNCQVTVDVYSHDNQTLLIPKGSRVLGEAKRVSDTFQQRIAISFHRLIMPDRFSVNLDQMPALDQGGETAVKDKVNHHYLSTFGTSIALGLLAGFSQFGSRGVYQGDGVDIYREGVAQSMSRDATRILDRQLNRMPTITIREGHRVRVWLTKDMRLPAYSEHPPQGL